MLNTNRPHGKGFIRFAIATALSLSLAGAAHAFDRYESQVSGGLLSAASLHPGDVTHDPHVGRLYRGQSDTLTLNLAGGVDYNIVGVCDEDCRDMDFHLYDENESLIDFDTELDATPVVVVTPAWTGPFSVLVEIPDCSAYRCTYGVVVLAN